MIKTLALSLALGVSSFLVQAQKNVTVSKPYAVIDAPGKYYFTQNGEILTVKTTRNSLTLQKLDAVTLSFKKIKLYDDFPKGFMLEKIGAIKKRYYVFYSLYVDEQEQLFAREIDFSSTSFKGAAKKILSVNEKISGSLARTGFAKVAITDKYDFFSSYDKSLLVIQYRIRPKIKNDNNNYDKIGTSIVDSDLNERWSAILTMPYTEEKMDNLDYSIDSKGNVYIVARVFNDNTTDQRKRGEDDANYHLEILKASAPTGVITTSKIEIGDNFINTLWLYEGVDGNMIGSGYYNKRIKHETNNVDGVMLVRLNAGW